MDLPADPPFVTFVRGEMGNHLRGVTRHRDGSFERLYVRGDHDPDAHDATLRAVVDGGSDRAPGGDHDATLRVSDEVAVLHFPCASGAETLVTVDPHTTIEPGFVRACSKLLDDEVTREVEAGPDR